MCWKPGTGTFDYIFDGSGSDKVRIDALASDLTFIRDATMGGLTITSGGSTLNIGGYFNGLPLGGPIEELIFSDGTVWTLQQVLQAVAPSPPPPPPNHAPTDIVLFGDAIHENAPNTSAFGHFLARDPDGNFLTYSLVDDAGGRFSLHENMLIVNDGSKLDYETNSTHNITVRVTDFLVYRPTRLSRSACSMFLKYHRRTTTLPSSCTFTAMSCTRTPRRAWPSATSMHATSMAICLTTRC